MKIEWKPEAIAAFEHAYRKTYTTRAAQIRAALDAAVEAHGITQTDLHAVLGYEAGHEAGRAEAFKVAATALENSHSTPRNEIAAILRALAKEKTE